MFNTHAAPYRMAAALLLALLTSCASLSALGSTTTATPTFTPSPTPTATPTFTPSPTPTASPTPLPPQVQTALDLLGAQEAPYTLADGRLVIDDYAAAGRQEIVLAPETLQVTATHDGLNPEILTAQSKEGRLYAYNPGRGWFAVPEVVTDYHLAITENKYTEVTQAYFEDGRANLVHALLYAQNPFLPAEVAGPLWWVAYNWRSNTMAVGVLPAFAKGNAAFNYPAQWEASTNYFDHILWPAPNILGLYRVALENGQTVYVVATTVNNPAPEDKSRMLNLFLGFDRLTWEMAIQGKDVDGRPDLDLEGVFNGLEEGYRTFYIVLVPPPKLPDGSAINPYPNLGFFAWHAPVMTGLYPPGKLVKLFPQEVQKQMLQMIADTYGGKKDDYPNAPLAEIPPELSRYILPGFIESSSRR